MNTIFMNSKNIKTPDSLKLLINLSEKINLKRSDKYVAPSNLSINCKWKNIKRAYKKKNLNYQLQRGTKNLNYLMGSILYQKFKIILNKSSRKV